MTASRRHLAVALTALAAACSRSSDRFVLPPNAAVDRSPVLVPFSSCEELERTIEDALVLRMRSTLAQGYRGIPGPVLGGVDAAPAPTAGPSDYTTTNGQVEGVGEADFVQNDRTRIAVLAGNRLHLARSWPPRDLSLASSVPIDGWPHDLFLAGDRVVVFSSIYVPRTLEGGSSACPAVLSPGGDFWCGHWAHSAVKITTIDVSVLDAPAVLSEAFLPGSYVSARRIDDRVRIVTSDSLPFPEGVHFWPSVAPGAGEEEWQAALAALALKNEQLIRARTLDDWLRRGSSKVAGRGEVELGHACTDFSRSSGPVRPGVLTVATFDLGASTLVSRTSVLAEPGVVYASQRTLYVASSHWWWWPEPGQRDATYLHAFDISSPDLAVYAGSGVVDGHVRDQYGLDEHDGALRVVTTVTERVDDGTPWGGLRTAGRLSVLKPEGGSLALVGETPEFGPDERVFGTRLLGTRGFVITARIIDPLFTFDLSDPANPVVVGELEMPGFISYLHPVDDTHLLGVGMEPAPGGGPNQVKVALLDVTDLSNPVDLDTVLVGEGWGWSEALWEPKAFTWLGSRRLLAIPFAEWTTTFRSDLRLFRVDAATGITPAGTLSMSDAYGAARSSFEWYWSPYVRRSILATDQDGAEYVYAVSDAGVRSANVGELPSSLATIVFDRWAP